MNIKLVIWDLDDTFWKGTLDEADVVPIPLYTQLIKDLNEHGILNSICSKNNYEKAKKTLLDMGIWDEFSMPQISWQPKGEAVKIIIDDFQLRAENVLFIDDNDLNLNEVKYYNPKINIAHSLKEDIQKIIEEIIKKNKTDNRRRFQEYKILEAKQVQKKTYVSNEDFLRQSNIRITINPNCIENLERIEELINRTNQLNFTKKRINKEDLKLLLINPEKQCYTIHARDNYGDYGLVGFVALDQINKKLDQFVFSCRTLNMGLEQYVWQKLGYPFLEIVGEVSSQLKKNTNVDWIAEETIRQNNNTKGLPQVKSGSTLLIGGCDLFQLHHYLKSNERIDTYFNYPSKKYNMPLHRDSINYLFASRFYKESQKKIILEHLPFAEDFFFQLPNLNLYQTIIYSPLIDYVQCQYRALDNETIISWGDFSKTKHDRNYEKETLKNYGLPDTAINSFLKYWTPLGSITGEQLQYKMEQVFNDYKGHLIIIGGATKKVPPNSQSYLGQHIQLNNILMQFSTARPNTHYIDINDCIETTNDFTDSIRHYKKPVYSRIATKIGNITSQLTIKSPLSLLTNRLTSYLKKISIKFILNNKEQT